MFYFHPYLGKIPMLTNIFEMGRNHQLGLCLIEMMFIDRNDPSCWDNIWNIRSH